MIWRQKTCQTCFPPQAQCDRSVPWLDRYPQLPQQLGSSLGCRRQLPARPGLAWPGQQTRKRKRKSESWKAVRVLLAAAATDLSFLATAATACRAE